MSAVVAEEMAEYSLRELLTPPPALAEPEDFDAFWSDTFQEFGSGEVAWSVTQALESTRTHRLERIRFASSCGEPVVAWLAVPLGPISRGLVVSHGYGGRTEPDLERLTPETAAIFPCAPGQEVNVPGRFPAMPSQHVLAGIQSRETYSHRFSAADIWRAATVLLDAAPAAARALDYIGGSFGGGIGALALPWDGRFRRASLDVPSFGHFPIRLSRKCTGSGEAVRLHLRRHPEVRPVLDYFDSAIAAKRIRIPVLVGAAVVDPSVHPGGQFAVYHALGGPRRLHVRACGHLDGPIEEESERLIRQATHDFFALDDSALGVDQESRSAGGSGIPSVNADHP